jgi:hypothetical protein
MLCAFSIFTRISPWPLQTGLFAITLIAISLVGACTITTELSLLLRQPTQFTLFYNRLHLALPRRLGLARLNILE